MCPQNLQHVQQLDADHCLEKISWLVSPSQQNLKKKITRRSWGHFSHDPGSVL
jgi:hypothetical protein